MFLWCAWISIGIIVILGQSGDGDQEVAITMKNEDTTNSKTSSVKEKICGTALTPKGTLVSSIMPPEAVENAFQRLGYCAEAVSFSSLDPVLLFLFHARYKCFPLMALTYISSTILTCSAKYYSHTYCFIYM